MLLAFRCDFGNPGFIASSRETLRLISDNVQIMSLQLPCVSVCGRSSTYLASIWRKIPCNEGASHRFRGSEIEIHFENVRAIKKLKSPVIPKFLHSLFLSNHT